MPLYEYQCQQCNRRIEKIQKYSDAPLTTCPHCSGTLERTLTAPAVQFKGSGWYKDLYSSAKPAASGSGEGASATGTNGGDPSSGGGGEGKPASAPAAASPSAAPAASAASAASGSKD